MLVSIVFGCVFFLQIIVLVFPLGNDRLCKAEESVPIQGQDQGENFIAEDGTVYKAGEFWRETGTNKTFGCTCLHRPCLKKCCPLEQVVTSYNDVGMTCGEVENKQWNFNDLKIYSSEDVENHKQVMKSINMGVRVGNPCKYGMFPTTSFHILDDGNIYEEYENPDYSVGHSIHGDSRYCVDYMNVSSDDNNTSFELILQAQICIDKDGDTVANSYTVYAVCIMINNVFLLMTLIVYCSLEILRNKMGISMIWFIVSLLIGYTALFYDRVTSFKKPLECKITAYTIYFFLMASYFWLNVMCYDIYSAFKTMKSVARSRTKKRNVMIAHCFYAWGSPFVMMVIAYFVDMYGPDYIIKPRLAVTSCWFGQTSSLYLYFYGPMMILLFANIFFFSVTIYKLYQVSKQTEVLKNTESKRHHQKEKDRCFLYGKLFVVMGVTWIMEVVSERIGGQEFWWYPTDIINICQGIGIFVIFVLKRRVLYMLNQKFCPSLNLIKESESPSSKPTSSSTGSTSQNGIAMNGATLNGNGNATNGNARREAPGNVYVGEEGYENPIPMTPLAERNNGDASIPIDDTDTRRRY